MMWLFSFLVLLVPGVNAFSSAPSDCDVPKAFAEMVSNFIAAEATCTPQAVVDCCWAPGAEATLWNATAPVAEFTSYSLHDWFKDYWFPVAFENCKYDSNDMEFQMFNWTFNPPRVVEAGFYPNRARAFHHVAVFDVFPGCKVLFTHQHHYVYTPGEYPATQTKEDYNPLS